MTVDELRAHITAELTPDPSGCLLWTGKLDRDGYGRQWHAGRYHLVHRLAWELFVGPIPAGMEIDHVKDRGCAYRNCANIAHLEVVTHRENSLRGDALPAVNARKTHCHRGHEFTEANTYRTPLGRRSCRACQRESARRYRTVRKTS